MTGVKATRQTLNINQTINKYLLFVTYSLASNSTDKKKKIIYLFICFFISTVNDGLTRTVPQYSGLRNALTEIAKSEGLKGLYRGVAPNILGSGSSWGFYFFL